MPGRYRRPGRRFRRRPWGWLVLLVVVAMVGLAAVFWFRSAAPGTAESPPVAGPAGASPIAQPVAAAQDTPTPVASPPSPPTVVPPPRDDSLLIWVNQERGLPPDFEPPDLVPVTGVPVVNQGMFLRRIALDALREMVASARAEGLQLVVSSAYRSYQTQVSVHNYWVQVLGPARAARVSAKPGHSEHQLGTTVDLTSPRVNYQLTEGFGETPEGRWLRASAHRFGFVMSYPAGKEDITGYDYEPWHFRYVGVEVATHVYQAGISLEEYFRSLDRP